MNMQLDTTVTTDVDIVQIDTIATVERHIIELLNKNQTTELLIAFDIDLTLTQPDHPALYLPNIKKYYNAIKQQTSCLTSEQKDIMINLSVTTAPLRLVENCTVKILQKLQNQAIKLIAFTAGLSGKLGHIKSLEQWRFESLSQLGLDFSKAFAKYPTITLKNLAKYRDNYPMFYQGVLVANGERVENSKAKTLIEFFKAVNYIPNYFVMVDDKKQNLTEIQQYLHAFNPNINFLGIEYTAGTTYAPIALSEEEFVEYWLKLAKQAVELKVEF